MNLNITKTFPKTFFSIKNISEFENKFKEICQRNGYDRVMETEADIDVSEDERRKYGEIHQFFSNYTNKVSSNLSFRCLHQKSSNSCYLEICYFSYGTTRINITHGIITDSFLEELLTLILSKVPESLMVCSPTPMLPLKDRVSIFLGHGGDPCWMSLKDHLRDKHGFKVRYYEKGARAGHQIRDVLEKELNENSFALIVFSGEDKDEDGNFHPRENVIHELGLFQGKLGFTRTVVLLERDIKPFSNINGTNYIPYDKGHIDGTFGEIIATLKREFGD